MNVQNNGTQITNPTFIEDAVLSNDSRKIFVLQGEHQRKWTAANPNGHIGVCLKIDGALIKNYEANKCDTGLLLDDNRLYLVEFKGSDYKKAVIQVVETQKFFRTYYSNIDFVFYARIVGKSFPKATTELQNAKKVLQKNFSNQFICFENKGEESV